MTNQERFVADWHIDVDRVHKIVRLAKEIGKLNEHFCNGDPHPGNPTPEDKNRNSELWGNAVDVAVAELAGFANAYGFTEVVFTGLGPTLKRGSQFVEVPY